MTLSMVMEHLSMVVFAIVIAILIGVPLGLLCYLSRAARGVVLRVVDLIQTTPALALLGIIMVTPLGAGKPTVILGLALYSLPAHRAQRYPGAEPGVPRCQGGGQGDGDDPRLQPLPRGTPPWPCPCCSPACASPWSTPSARRYSPPRWAAAAWATSSIPASAATTWP
ncbi:hypothetical protein M5E87_27750 [Flavonifractor plautii]|nr:hypothetical protein M5E87_27750 [Flavonifractor plautii]